MCVCGCEGVYGSTIKRKPVIGMTLKFGTVDVLDSLSKSVDFRFKRSRVMGTVAELKMKSL